MVSRHTFTDCSSNSFKKCPPNFSTLSLLWMEPTGNFGSAAMMNFLRSHGQWKCVKSRCTSSFCSYYHYRRRRTKNNGAKQSTLLGWRTLKKALGNILLRLHPNIGYQFNNATDPSILWADLQIRFGKPGMATAFMEIKGIMDTAIPNNSNPNPALNKIMAHFLHLKEMDYEISNRGPRHDDSGKSSSIIRHPLNNCGAKSILNQC